MSSDIAGDETGARARELFLSGYNCAESVLKAVSESLGTQDELIPRVASGFGAGIGRTGGPCGAITGATMAAGIAVGRDTADAERAPSYEACASLVEEFAREFGSTVCRTLIDVDWSDPEQSKLAHDDPEKREKCARFVEFAAATMSARLSRDTEEK